MPSIDFGNYGDNKFASNQQPFNISDTGGSKSYGKDSRKTGFEAYTQIGNKWMGQTDKLDKKSANRAKAKGKAQAHLDQKETGEQNNYADMWAKVKSSPFSGNGNASVGGNADMNIGKKGNTNIDIGNNNEIGAGSSIGNDYSVTIGGQGIGGNGTGGGAGGTQFNNMTSAAAYNALNDNAWAKSQSQLNGLSRATAASEQAAKVTGASDRVQSLYNSVGMDQNYWNKKAQAQQNFYLGDIFNSQHKAPDWTMPDAPEKIEDQTADIYEDAKEEIGN